MSVSELTKKRLACLKHYAQPERGRKPSRDSEWDSRQMNWALQEGLLKVGPDIGAHVLSDKGRAFLALNSETGTENSLSAKSEEA